MLILQNRAQAATELLQELNSDVSGNFVEEVSVNVIKCVVVLLSELKPYLILDICFIRDKLYIAVVAGMALNL